MPPTVTGVESMPALVLLQLQLLHGCPVSRVYMYVSINVHTHTHLAGLSRTVMMAGFAKPPQAKDKKVKPLPPADLTGLRKHELGGDTKVCLYAPKP